MTGFATPTRSRHPVRVIIVGLALIAACLVAPPASAKPSKPLPTGSALGSQVTISSGLPGIARSVPGPTACEQTPVSREKPFLFVDGRGRWKVRVPSAHRNTRGITWADGPTAGPTIPRHRFHVAKPGDSVRKINRQLARGGTCCSPRACTTWLAASR